MTSLTTASTIFLVIVFATAANSLNPLSDEFISLINSKQNSWRAGQNFAVHTPMSHIKKLMGVLKTDHQYVLPNKVHDADLIKRLPDHFDPRTKWPNCQSLNEVRDQGQCGACWAFGAVEAMTDRVCILSNGTKIFHFSAQDLLSCSRVGGCGGGVPQLAWRYWKDEGIVSGGAYNSSEGCRPYDLPSCDHVINGTCGPYLPTPKCENKCRSGYNTTYQKDKQRGKSVYFVSGEEHIKAELFTNGPVESAFDVYEDFVHYKNGVYFYTGGVRLGGHAVKMMGWGEEGGVKYWLLTNSWNSEWGDKGFFKIRRGTNECGIEDEIIAGMPLFDDLL